MTHMESRSSLREMTDAPSAPQRGPVYPFAQETMLRLYSHES